MSKGDQVRVTGTASSIEYLGVYADVPLDVILEGWENIYGKDHIKARIEELEKGKGISSHNFDKEDVVKI